MFWTNMVDAPSIKLSMHSTGD